MSRIVIFDASYGDVAAALGRAGIPATRVTAYSVSTGPLPMAGSHTVRLADIAGALRAIGYVRLIQDAMVTRPSLAIPPGIRGQLFPVPRIGNLTTRTPVPSGKEGIRDYVRSHRTEINRILAGESRRTAPASTPITSS